MNKLWHEAKRAYYQHADLLQHAPRRISCQTSMCHRTAFSFCSKCPIPSRMRSSWASLGTSRIYTKCARSQVGRTLRLSSSMISRRAWLPATLRMATSFRPASISRSRLRVRRNHVAQLWCIASGTGPRTGKWRSACGTADRLPPALAFHHIRFSDPFFHAEHVGCSYCRCCA